MADGSIRIETKLDNSTLKQQIKELEGKLKNIQKEQAKVDAQVDSTMAKYQAEREFDSQFPEEFSHRENIDKRAAAELDPLIAKQEELNQQAQQYLALRDAVKAKLAEEASIMAASKQVDNEVKADTSMAKVQTQAQYNSLLDATAAKMAAIEAAAAREAAQRGLAKEQILAANPAYQRLSDTMGMLKSRSHEFGNEANNAGKKASSAMKKAEVSTKRVGDATKRCIMGFGKAQLAMMAIMFAMRAVSAATQEYMSVNSELEGQMNTLKALWGQVLGPVIEWVINLLIKAISVVNAFVQALTGINFVARANEAALKKQAKASGGSGNSTAGFDEQTKLSGGGSGDAVATLPDGSSLDLSFLDPLMEAITKFKEDISPLLDTIGSLFKWLWDEVLVPFGDWALNSVLPEFLDILGGAFLVLNDALILIQPILQWLWDEILEPIAEWTGGVIVDVLSEIGDWIKENREPLSIIVAILGVLIGILVVIPALLSAIATVLGILFSPITLIVTAIGLIIYAFVECYNESEEFRQSLEKMWAGIKKIVGGAVNWITSLLDGDWAGVTKAYEEIKEGAGQLLEGFVEGLEAKWDWFKKRVTENWQKVTGWFKETFGIEDSGEKSTVFASYGGAMGAGIAQGMSGKIKKIVDECKKIWNTIKGVFSSVGTWFKDTFSNAWQKVKDVFSKGGKIFDGIKDGISSTFKTIVNGLIDGINRIIRVPFNAINGMLNTIRGITILGITPFKNMWSYNPLSVPQIPKLALGGIVNRPGRGVPAIIGEAGAEAVLPLENNTEWMDILADKIGGNVTIPIILDGKKIATYVVDIQKKKAFAMNGV